MNEKAHFMMLGSLNNILLWQHMGTKTTYEILMSMYEMFGAKGRVDRQATLRSIMNTRTIGETLIRYHIIHMYIL